MPFVEKDEVIVIIPHGDLKSGPVIIGRLNQAIDTFPGIVAGQDATKNTFGFWRLRVPFVIETGESFLIRSAKTGAQIGIDPTGQIIFNNGDKHHIIIASDAIAFSSGDEKTFLQLNFTEGRATIAVDGGRFELSKTGESQLFAPGVLNLGAGGARGSGHAVTVEQLIAWTANLVCQLALTGAFTSTIPNPYTSAAWPAGAPAALNALFAAMIPAQTSSVPIGTAGTPGGDTTLIAPALSLLNVALAVPPDQTGFIPGLGRGSLML